MPATLPTPRTLTQLRRRLAHVPDAGWAPPPLPDLIARIDSALAQRRGG